MTVSHFVHFALFPAASLQKSATFFPDVILSATSLRKTGQMMFIRWEKCMQSVIDRHPVSSSPFLLPIITSSERDHRTQYIYMIHKVNTCLRNLGKQLNLPVPLTMYVARHTGASTAHRENIPISVISEGMGHTSEKTTRIYLDSLDTNVIDEANRMILGLI